MVMKTKTLLSPRTGEHEIRALNIQSVSFHAGERCSMQQLYTVTSLMSPIQAERLAIGKARLGTATEEGFWNWHAGRKKRSAKCHSCWRWEGPAPSRAQNFFRDVPFKKAEWQDLAEG